MRTSRMNVIYFLVTVLMFTSCSGDKIDLYDKITKVDAHVHIRTGDPAIMEFAKAQGFKFLTINTRSSSQEYIDQQRGYAKGMKILYPDRIAWIATFSMEDFESPGWAENVIMKLQKDFDEGAIGVKVWKDIGMTFRDSLDNFVLIDDPLFEPILDFITKSEKPLVAHIGEPKNCWLPIESMTVNSDKSYFTNNPQYHMYLHPEYPTHEMLIESRDNVLARHPDLELIGAHLGSLEYDVDKLAERLDRFPNFAVDMAERVCHFQVQEREKVRDFIMKYQDRLLYGSDLGIREDTDIEERKVRLEKTYRSDWAYFATADSMDSPKVNSTFVGLDLDKDVLEKIYYSNAVRWYPGGFD